MVQEITIRLRVDGPYELAEEELVAEIEYRLCEAYFSLDINAEVIETEDI